jgi:ubiquinone/menaquinone biosynthesis C-methylase UbiE
MDRNELSLCDLHCPYCGSSLQSVFGGISGTVRTWNDGKQYGILRCSCSEYPVVDGIPIIQQVEGLAGVIQSIRSSDHLRALYQTLNIFRVKWAHRSRWHQFRYHLNCRALVTSDRLSFENAANLVRTPRVFADYLIHRYANPSFLAAVGLLQLLKCDPSEVSDSIESDHALSSGQTSHSSKAKRILDLACGAGHSSFIMHLVCPSAEVISADHDFVSLYLAKRFISPRSTHLCLDAEVPSPFRDSYFDAVYCLDAFHYLGPKRTVVSELKRVARENALWLFPHLHNSLQENITAGIPLSPEGYLQCFDLPAARLFDEAEVLNHLVRNYVLPFDEQCAMKELECAKNLILVAGPRKIWRSYKDFPARLCGNPLGLALNPIYRPHGRTGVQLKWPNSVIRQECRSAECILPAEIDFGGATYTEWLEKNLGNSEAELRNLVGKFILVALPPRYCENN